MIFEFDCHANLGDESVLQFYGCNDGVDALGNSLDADDADDWCGEFQAKTHPVCFIISIVFLIITLFVYLAEDSLRYKTKQALLRRRPQVNCVKRIAGLFCSYPYILKKYQILLKA